MTSENTVNDSQLRLEKMGINVEEAEKLLSFKNENDEYLYDSYQFSLLINQIRSIAELFNCARGKRGNKFTQSALKQKNCIVDFIA